MSPRGIPCWSDGSEPRCAVAAAGAGRSWWSCRTSSGCCTACWWRRCWCRCLARWTRWTCWSTWRWSGSSRLQCLVKLLNKLGLWQRLALAWWSRPQCMRWCTVNFLNKLGLWQRLLARALGSRNQCMRRLCLVIIAFKIGLWHLVQDGSLCRERFLQLLWWGRLMSS